MLNAKAESGEVRNMVLVVRDATRKYADFSSLGNDD